MINIISNKRDLQIANHLSQWLTTRRPRRTNKGSFIPAQPTRCSISPIASAGRLVLVGAPPQAHITNTAKAGPIVFHQPKKNFVFVVNIFIVITYVVFILLMAVPNLLAKATCARFLSKSALVLSFGNLVKRGNK
jgi:hypothetical protein